MQLEPTVLPGYTIPPLGMPIEWSDAYDGHGCHSTVEKTSRESLRVHHIPINIKPVPHVFALILIDIGPRIRPRFPLKETAVLTTSAMIPPIKENNMNKSMENTGPRMLVLDPDSTP